MRSKDILYSNGGNDECYTPAYAVEPIAKYVADYERNVWKKNGNITKRNLIVWCPFDKKDSEFVKQLSKWAFIDVVFSHIDNGQDFFNYEPKEWDIIVSNPPFTNKRKYFERALSFNKPFALIMTNAAFNDKYPIWSFEEAGKQFQCLKFDKRIHFIKPDGTIQKKTTFGSSYFCYNFLPRDFIQEKINF